MSTHNHDHELRYVLDGEMPEDEPQRFSFKCGTCGPEPFDWESKEGKELMMLATDELRKRKKK